MPTGSPLTPMVSWARPNPAAIFCSPTSTAACAGRTIIIPLPDDPLWDGGVRAGVTWDGTFYRDTARYPAGGQLFWSAYFKPGSAAGIKQGFWFNFGSGWSHLANDDPAQILAGASQRIYYDSGVNGWRLVIEATQFVTNAVVNVWTGTKTGGTDPVGIYQRESGCDPLASLTVEAG